MSVSFSPWAEKTQPSPSRTVTSPAETLLSEHRIDGTLIVQIRAFEAAGYAPVAQGDDAVGEPADVGHPVRDIKDRDATGFQPIEKLEQPIGLGARQRRGRLVEDQHLRLVRHGAGDRHHLPVGERQIVDISGKIDGEAHAGGDRRQPRALPGAG